MSGIWRRSLSLWGGAWRCSMPIRSIAWSPGRRKATGCWRAPSRKCPDSADTLRSRAHKAEKRRYVLIDTPPGIAEVGYQAALAADLLLLPCGPSPLRSIRAEGSTVGAQARAERRSKKPRIRFVPSKVVMTTNLGRGLAFLAQGYGKEGSAPIGQRV